MTSVLTLWKTNKEFFEGKGVQQILAMCADGKLRDSSDTSNEFREFLRNITSNDLEKYANECLDNSFPPDSGLVLQDIVNEIGSRIGFDVRHGLYKGTRKDIGCDGVCILEDRSSIVIEVKTTDTYRINLDSISGYRTKLIQKGDIQEGNSSILIIVGRQDTGDLEAQIRGSKHAWDIRLISTDSLIKLMFVKEDILDPDTATKTHAILKPLEYTRIDHMIDIIFSTSRDIKIDTEDTEAEAVEEETDSGLKNKQTPKYSPVHFHDACVEKLEKYFKEPLIKRSRASYTNGDQTLRIICTISKTYASTNKEGDSFYWFSYHTYYNEFLAKAVKGFTAFGCGNAEQIILVPYKEIEPLLKDLWYTVKENGQKYWHFKLFKKQDRIYIQVPKKNTMYDVSEKRLKIE